MALDRSRIRLLCFDVDGTLSDTDDQFVLRLSRWLKPFRSMLPRRDPLALARRIVMATESPATWFYGLPDRLGLDAPLASLGNLIYRIGLGRNPRPFMIIPGVLETLTLLGARYPMTIVSARDPRSAASFLNQFELGASFLHVVTARTCIHTKPYPDPILWAARQVNVPADACVMIGDTTVDIMAGKAAGAQTVGVLCGFGEEAELRRAGADIILPSTADLGAILV